MRPATSYETYEVSANENEEPERGNTANPLRPLLAFQRRCVRCRLAGRRRHMPHGRWSGDGHPPDRCRVPLLPRSDRKPKDRGASTLRHNPARSVTTSIPGAITAPGKRESHLCTHPRSSNLATLYFESFAAPLCPCSYRKLVRSGLWRPSLLASNTSSRWTREAKPIWNVSGMESGQPAATEQRALLCKKDIEAPIKPNEASGLGMVVNGVDRLCSFA
jgi:hypothetical protein